MNNRWNGLWRPWLWLGICCFCGVARSADVPAPWHDDAELRAVQFVDAQHGWACGEHGTVWQTTDGGEHWKLSETRTTASLRSVCFINAKEGWIAGGSSQPYSHAGLGTILRTQDGGASWLPLSGADLPELHRIKFFTPKNGIAVGEPNAWATTGVIVTNDGGETWKPVPGDLSGSWRAADFLHPEAGSLAGARGQRAIFGAGRLVPHTLANLGLRGIHDLKFARGGQGWLVGDGGLVLFTKEAGIGWEAPASPLPDEVRQLFDFQALATHGNRVWVGGSPGSVIWHSPDAGATWEPQLTQQTLPIRGLHFSSELNGWAVGALGVMLHTTDGGHTWLAVRGGDRRAAYWAACSRVETVSMALVGNLSGEHGYRGVITVLPRQDLGPDVRADRELDLRLSEAITRQGGSAGLLGWQWTLEIPGLADSEQRLIEHWTKQSEGQFAEQFVGRLVRQLRTWRPSVVVIEEPTEQTPIAKLIKQATLVALRQAGDPARFSDQIEIANLPTWQVPRIFVKLPAGSLGQVSLEPHEFLPRTGKSLAAATSRGAAILWREPPLPTRETLRAISPQGELIAYSGQNLFAGLNLAPGSEARRELPNLNDSDLARQLKLAQQQRNYQSYIDKFLHDGRHANQLLAQLGDMTAGLPDDQAALQLAQLAEAYRRQGQWELCEGVLTALVENYPHEPPAQDAMRWLFQMWVGLEPSYSRLRGRHVESRTEVRIDQQEIARRWQNATRVFQPGQETPANQAIAANLDLIDAQKNPALQKADKPFSLQTGLGSSVANAQQGVWFDKAKRMAGQLERLAPAWYRTPEIQAPLASLMRQRQQQGEALQIYPRLQAGSATSPWAQTAATEMWLMSGAGIPPKNIYNSPRASAPPELDGLLSDACWQAAAEMTLKPAQANQNLGDPAIVLLCYDTEFLYLGGIVPRVPGTTATPIELAGRQHDADLRGQDQLTLLLDVDRDYTTYYRLQVDQRGWTAEDCWGDTTWNPKWYVAASGDDDYWRVEIAIPWEELTPKPPTSGNAWAIQAWRTIPGMGVQTWTEPAASIPRLETGGILRFE